MASPAISPSFSKLRPKPDLPTACWAGALNNGSFKMIQLKKWSDQNIPPAEQIVSECLLTAQLPVMLVWK
jgi:hypothetical protein